MSWEKRIAVTGVGAVTPFGWSLNDFRRGMRDGDCAIGTTRNFDTDGQRTRIAGEVDSTPTWPSRVSTSAAELSRTDRFAVMAAAQACDEAAIDPNTVPVGVYFGSSTGGMYECEEYLGRVLGHRAGRPALRLLRSQQLNGPGDAVARCLGATGPVETVSSACASGALAIASAMDALRTGEVEVAIAGGADGLCLLTYSGFNTLRLVDPDPCRPFRADRRGMNLGEGAGVLVLETPGHAADRGARPLAWLLGAGASCDAHHMTAPHPEGEGSARAIRAALEDAGVDEGDVGFVNAHGTGTPQNDLAEARALRTVFGRRGDRLPVTATKGSIGHLLGASGAIEAVETVLCLDDSCVHRTPGGGEVDPECSVDLVLRDNIPLPAGRFALSTSFAFGGANAALVFADYRGGEPW